MNVSKKISNIGMLLTFMVLGVLSLISFGRAVSNTLSKTGAMDLHSYWYSGHFLRQNIDPYDAFFRGMTPTVPITYLDGMITSTLPVAQPGLQITPANTAPMVLILSLFAFLSWQKAKILWMICNLLFMIIIPWMVIRLFDNKTPVKLNIENVFLALSFWALFATRNAVILGQTTLIVFVLMLLTLLMVDINWMVAGLALGIALSKYSLSFPILLFMLFKREYRIVVVACITQAIGLIILSLLTRTKPWEILNEYLLMIKWHAPSDGIHLAALMINAPALSIAVVSIFTLIILGFTWDWVRHHYQRLSEYDKNFSDLHILTILVLWALLSVYHKEYDAVVFILFTKLVLCGLTGNKWRISHSSRNGLALLLLCIILWLGRPNEIMFYFSPPHLAQLWIQVSKVGATLALTLSLGLTLTLLYRMSYTARPTIPEHNRVALEQIDNL